MDIYIDLETVPTQDEEVKASIAEKILPPDNYTKQETIDKWIAEKKPALVEAEYLKTSFDGSCGMIAVIGIAIDNDEPLAFFSPNWREDEKAVIADAMEFLRRSITKQVQHSNSRVDASTTYIGHNHVDFDLRFLMQRCIANKVRPHNSIPFKAKPWDNTVYDTMAQWAGAKGRIGLSRLAKALGEGDKGGIDGSMVWPMVRDGKIGEVADYCKNDVQLTRRIHHRMTFRGVA